VRTQLVVPGGVGDVGVAAAPGAAANAGARATGKQPRNFPLNEYESSRGSAAGEDHLERAGVGGTGEHVVGLDELVEVEVVGHESSSVDLIARGQS
jgi:hypothetical protein